ncbi:DUF1330 domain-containing protein [Aureimonas ureilytica]|uniref:DUF1330 domain-containing protein n=1 Tax=Aureimonas ureilytica TaxID=401562 RepID=UPI000B26C4B8
MPVYPIPNVTVRDHAAFETCRSRAAASIEAFGGRHLVRGRAISVLEGEPQHPAIVVVEFPDAATARRWYASPE